MSKQDDSTEAAQGTSAEADVMPNISKPLREHLRSVLAGMKLDTWMSRSEVGTTKTSMRRLERAGMVKCKKRGQRLATLYKITKNGADYSA